MNEPQTARKKLFDFRFTLIMTTQAVLLILILVTIISLKNSSSQKKADMAKEVAGHLHAAGLGKEAIAYYETYLNFSNNANPKQKAKIAYSIGELLEQEGQPERALAWYYQVKAWNPDAAEAPEASKKIVALLEQLGKVVAAKTALKHGTSLDPVPPPEGAVMVASLGNRPIYLHDINNAIEHLPPEIKKSFLTKEGKEDFLRKYVAEEILWDKAKRLNLVHQPEIQRELKLIEKQLLVGKILEQEIYRKITVDPQDVKNFFNANEKKYAEKAKAAGSKQKPDFEKMRQQVEMDYRMQKGQSLYQELIEKTLQGDNIKLFTEKMK